MKILQQKVQVNDEPSGTLFGYVMDNSEEIDPKRKRPAVIICPGGGYEYTSDREAEPVALKLLSCGFQAFVLRYSVTPVHYPVALHQLAQSVAYVRAHSTELGIDPRRIIVMGFSAGGHLAACLGVFWNTPELANIGLNPTQMQPNGLMLGYPVITSGTYGHQASFENLLGADLADWKNLSLEYQANADVPETFLWHTASDAVVPMENSLLFAQALRKYKIPLEYHVFPKGQHGASLATSEVNGDPQKNQPELAVWFDLFVTWAMHQII